MQDIQEILAELADHINQRRDKLTKINCGVQLDLTGDGGGKYQILIDESGAKIDEGELEKPTITVRVDVNDFKEMAARRLDDINRALMSGKVKIRGNLAMAFKLQSLLR